MLFPKAGTFADVFPPLLSMNFRTLPVISGLVHVCHPAPVQEKGLGHPTAGNPCILRVISVVEPLRIAKKNRDKDAGQGATSPVLLFGAQEATFVHVFSHRMGRAVQRSPCPSTLQHHPPRASELPLGTGVLVSATVGQGCIHQRAHSCHCPSPSEWI